MSGSSVDPSPAASPSRTSPIVAIGNFLFRYRNAVFPLVFMAIVFLDRPRYPLGSGTLDRALDVAGIALAVAGQALRALVIGLAYIRRGGKEGKVHADDLVQEGIFAHSRNPLYVGNALVFLGLFVVLNSWLGYLLGVPAMFVAYLSLVRAEEEFLAAKFGESYREYCRRVPRFLPKLAGLRGTVAGMQFDWARVVRKEYGSTWTWITVVIGLLFWERFSVEGPGSVRTTGYVAAWVAVTVLYGVARFLKKTKRLG